MDDMDNQNLKDFAEYIRGLAPVESIVASGAEVVAVPHGKKLESLKPFIDVFRLFPERLKGTATLSDIPSFIAHINRFKDTDSAIFAVRSPSEPRLIGVLNYSGAGDDKQRFGDHRAVYAFPLSKEWKAWRAGDKIKMAQRDFAEFLENHILDVLPPPTPPADGAPADDPISALARLLGGSFAGPDKLLALSRGMAINADVKAANAINISSGETQILFSEEHKDGEGAPLKVPGFFLIGIPVFDQGPLYRLAVRLRYRLVSGTIGWFYEIYRADKAFNDAFEESATKAQKECALPLFYGLPEA